MTPEEIEALKNENAALKAVNETLVSEVKNTAEKGKAKVTTVKLGKETFKMPYNPINHKGTILTDKEVAKVTDEALVAEYLEYGVIVK